MGRPFYYLVPQGIKLSTAGKCQYGQNTPVKVQVAAQGGLYLVPRPRILSNTERPCVHSRTCVEVEIGDGGWRWGGAGNGGWRWGANLVALCH